MSENEEVYSTIRDILGWSVGSKIIDITQHDEDEWAEDKRSYVMLLLDNGGTLKFFVGDDGFSYCDPNGPDEDEDEDDEQ